MARKNTRQNLIVVIVGKPNTGKTFYTLRLIDKAKKKVVIFDLNNEEKYRKFKLVNTAEVVRLKSGKVRTFTNQPEQLLQAVHDHVRNAMVIFEDSTSYVNSSTTQLFRKILVSRRHWNLDIIFTFHSLNLVPPVIFELCNYVVVKKTQDTEKKLRRIDKIPNPDELLTAWRTVQASKDPYAQMTVQAHG